MEKYGSDKPDLRNPLIIQDASELFRGCDFKAFAGVVASGGVVKTIAAKGCADKSRKFFDDLIKFAQGVGSKGLGYLRWIGGEVQSPIAKFLSDEIMNQLKELGGVGDGDVMFFIADKAKEATSIAASVRDELGRQLELIDPNVFKFCWIVDFPMYELDDEGKVEFSHNPFSMPQGGMDDLLNKDPLEILAYQYDIVCNGTELSSGAVRNHSPEMMIKAFDIAGYGKAVVESKFPALYKAFQYGAPPHAGIAPGVDRIIMLLADEPNIREVIAFPMNQKAQDLLMGAPSEVEFNQIRDLHLRLHLPKKVEKETLEGQ
jgi:aspartyl-tRNA synthetase